MLAKWHTSNVPQIRALKVELPKFAKWSRSACTVIVPNGGGQSWPWIRQYGATLNDITPTHFILMLQEREFYP